MSQGRANEDRLQAAGQDDIGDETAAPGNKVPILDPRDGETNMAAETAPSLYVFPSCHVFRFSRRSGEGPARRGAAAPPRFA